MVRTRQQVTGEQEPVQEQIPHGTSLITNKATTVELHEARGSCSPALSQDGSSEDQQRSFRLARRKKKATERVCTHLTADREQTNGCEDMAGRWESSGVHAQNILTAIAV